MCVNSQSRQGVLKRDQNRSLWGIPKTAAKWVWHQVSDVISSSSRGEGHLEISRIPASVTCLITQASGASWLPLSQPCKCCVDSSPGACCPVPHREGDAGAVCGLNVSLEFTLTDQGKKWGRLFRGNWAIGTLPS